MDLSHLTNLLKSPVVRETYADIKAVKIQGATNVAVSTIKTTIKWLKLYKNNIPPKWLLPATVKILKTLAYARPNEPLAQNSIRYLLWHTKDISTVKADYFIDHIISTLNNYLSLIEESKRQILNWGTPLLTPVHIIFTHCHSSTATKLIIQSNAKLPKTVIATETRPLMQGRITARELIQHNVNTIMIVDSASAYFISDSSYLDIEAILIGADQIQPNGTAINKVGSFTISLAAHTFKKPLYVVTPSLKLSPDSTDTPTIELRPPQEIWKDAPKQLKIINPAFEPIPPSYITGFITELGVLKPYELYTKVIAAYPWLKVPIP